MCTGMAMGMGMSIGTGVGTGMFIRMCMGTMVSGGLSIAIGCKAEKVQFFYSNPRFDSLGS